MATTIDYPTNLPGVLVSSDTNKDIGKYRRNDTEIGPPVYELLSTTGPSLFNCVWSFEEFDFQVFEGWYKKELLFGSKSFNIDLIVGKGLTAHECFFNSQYNRSRNGKRFRVSAQLLAVEKIYDTDDVIDEIIVLRESVIGSVPVWVDKYNELIENSLAPAFPSP